MQTEIRFGLSVEELEVGDYVFVRNMSSTRVDKITKVTKTQIVVGNNRFRRQSIASAVGSTDYSTLRLVPIKDEEELEAFKERIQVVKTSREVRKAIIEASLSSDQWKRILHILRE